MIDRRLKRRVIMRIGRVVSIVIVFVGLINLRVDWGVALGFAWVGIENGNFVVCWLGSGIHALDEFGYGLDSSTHDARLNMSLPTVHKTGLFGAAGWKWWHWEAAMPLWLAFVLTASTTCFLWYRDRRMPPGNCQNCGYDLMGNVSGRCPECGMVAKREGEEA